MRYVCTRCGEILSEDKAVKDPYGDIECESCYLKNKSEWFSDEKDTTLGNKQPEQKRYFVSDDLNCKPGPGYEKKGFWKK